MIISPNKFTITLDEVESLFNKLLEKELEQFEENKKSYIDEPFNEATYMPDTHVRVWLKVGHDILSTDVEKSFKKDIEMAGWQILEWTWHKNERTNEDEIIIGIKKV